MNCEQQMSDSRASSDSATPVISKRGVNVYRPSPSVRELFDSLPFGLFIQILSFPLLRSSIGKTKISGLLKKLNKNLDSKLGSLVQKYDKWSRYKSLYIMKLHAENMRLNKLFDKAARYVRVKDLRPERKENVERVFRKAIRRLRKRTENFDNISPRLLSVVLNEGSFSSYELAAEYLGGFLVSSSIKKDPLDDRGARMAKIITTLSTYQLRTHYLVYCALCKMFAGTGHDLYSKVGRKAMRIFISYADLRAGMEIPDAVDDDRFKSIFTHCFYGLTADKLLDDKWYFGPKEWLRENGYATAYTDGILCQPSAMGVEVFLWAFGLPDKPLNYIFSSEFKPKMDSISESIDVIPVRS